MDQREAIRARGLTAGYEARVVLERLDLAFGAGRVTVIAGPGGSGKSTLLRAIAGPVAGGPLWRSGHLERPERFAALWQRRVPDPESLARLLAGPDAAGRLERFWRPAPGAAEALLRAGQEAQPARWACRLAELTLAADSDTPLLLLDEPEVGLGDEERGWLERRIKAWRGERTVVLVTHHLGLARAVADDVLLLVDGVVIEAGAAPDFFLHPAKQRTRDFVRLGA